MDTGDAYHLSGLYSHHEASSTTTTTSSKPSASSTIASSTGQVRSSACNTPSAPGRGTAGRQSTGSTGSVGRWRHHTPIIGRNNSTASNTSNASTREAASSSLPVSPEGPLPFVGVETWGSGQILEVEGECEISTACLQAPPITTDASVSLMETSTVTTSTVDSTAELVHR